MICNLKKNTICTMYRRLLICRRRMPLSAALPFFGHSSLLNEASDSFSCLSKASFEAVAISLEMPKNGIAKRTKVFWNGNKP